jgi:micrococcal nuclease
MMLNAAMSCDAGERCGPPDAVVSRVLDGDTVELEGGQLVRYLMVDAPEVGHAEECFGALAAQSNSVLVLGQRVQLRYDAECRDDYDRLLAYVSVEGREVNSILLERGYACVQHIPPNGDERLDELNALEAKARAQRRGLWGACSAKPCR